MWRHDETQLLIEQVRKMGTQWNLIAKLFGRSTASVRGRWKRVSAEDGGGLKTIPHGRHYQQVCKICGQRKRGHICKPLILASVARTVQGTPLPVFYDATCMEEFHETWNDLLVTAKNNDASHVQETESDASYA